MKHFWIKDEDLGTVCDACGTYHHRVIEDEECPGEISIWADAAVIASVIGLAAVGIWAAFFGLGA